MGIDPRKYGPTRGELKFRLAFSVAALLFLAVAIATTGIPSVPAMVELFGIAGLFLVGTIVWCVRRLILRLHP
jgi:Na+/melibiose symporter-like transporter